MTHEIEGTPVAFISVSERKRALASYCEVLGFELRSTGGFGDIVRMAQDYVGADFTVQTQRFAWHITTGSRFGESDHRCSESRRPAEAEQFGVR